jgi:hypothetical protein
MTFCLRISAGRCATRGDLCFSRHPRDLGAGLGEKGEPETV